VNDGDGDRLLQHRGSREEGRHIRKLDRKRGRWSSPKGGNGGGVATESGGVDSAPVSWCGWEVEEGRRCGSCKPSGENRRAEKKRGDGGARRFLKGGSVEQRRGADPGCARWRWRGGGTIGRVTHDKRKGVRLVDRARRRAATREVGEVRGESDGWDHGNSTGGDLQNLIQN
jgi:hypothetical protein